MEKLSSEAIKVESRVQVDGRVVTSRGPGTAIEFSLALVEQLYGKKKADEVAGPMVISLSLSGKVICVLHFLSFVFFSLLVIYACTFIDYNGERVPVRRLSPLPSLVLGCPQVPDTSTSEQSKTCNQNI